MPGNEFGEKIHDFFAQENVSQGQHKSQVIDGSLSGLSNHSWSGNQRQIGVHFISNLKNNNVQQSAHSDRGHEIHSSRQHEFATSTPQGQYPNLNGYMHGNQGFQIRNNEENTLGLDRESNHLNLTSRGFSVLESQFGNAPEQGKKNFGRMDLAQSQVNYDFFGGQQQRNSQSPGMLQPLSRLQQGVNETRLLQQEVVLKQMQGIQMQQQLQEQQFLQQQSTEPNSFKLGVGSHFPAPINGVPVENPINTSWRPDFMADNTNWTKHGLSPVIQCSSGLMMGMFPPQIDQSCNGAPISGMNASPSRCSPVPTDRVMQQASGSNYSFLHSHYTRAEEQANLHDTLVHRLGCQDKSVGIAEDQDLNGRFSLQNQQPVNYLPHHRLTQALDTNQELSNTSETSEEKKMLQVAPQNLPALDPTEEKILFGSDDNLWEAFGQSADVGLGSSMFGGMDSSGLHPSVQSGSWSALMQSAVAETSRTNTVVQEEWSGLTLRSDECPAGSKQTPHINDGKQQMAWPDKRQQIFNNHNTSHFPSTGDTNASTDYDKKLPVQQFEFSISKEQSERFQVGSSDLHIQQHPHEETKWSGHSLPPSAVVEGHHNDGLAHSPHVKTDTPGFLGSRRNLDSAPSSKTGSRLHNGQNEQDFVHPMSHGKVAFFNGQERNNPSQVSHRSDQRGLNLERVGPVSGTVKTDSTSHLVDHNLKQSAIGNGNYFNLNSVLDSGTMKPSEKSPQLSNRNNSDFWKNVHPSKNLKGGELSGNFAPHMSESHKAVDLSIINSSSNGTVEMQKPLNSNIQVNTDVSCDTLSTDVRGDTGYGPADSHKTPAGIQNSSSHKQKLPGHAIQKPSIRKFQYHPMGNVDIDTESYATNNVTHSQSTLRQVPNDSTGHHQSYTGPVKFPSQMPGSSMEMEKDCGSGFGGETGGLEEMRPRIMFSGSAHGSSSPFGRGVHDPAPKKNVTPSQNMLELLHKVDRPKEQDNVAQQCTSSNVSQFSDFPENASSDGSIRFQHNQSPASQGFGLQLAPPNQASLVQGHTSPSQNSSLMNSLAHKKGNTWLSPVPTFQSQSPPCGTSQVVVGNNMPSISGPVGIKDQESFSAALQRDFSKLSSSSQHQPLTDKDGRESINKSANISLEKLTSPPKEVNESFDRAVARQSTLASMPNMSNSTDKKITSTTVISPISTHFENLTKVSTHQFSRLDAKQTPDSHTVSGQQNDSKIPNCGNNGSVRVEKSHISPQTTPSWFHGYGTIKNGQILPIHDAQKDPAINTMKEADAVASDASGDAVAGDASGDAVVADANQCSVLQKCSTWSAQECENVSSCQVSRPDANDLNLNLLKPKKRKSSPLEPSPWHKEVTQDCSRLQNISAEENWAQATNRLAEKVGDEPDIYDDVSPVLRSKKRLILTTQLMQQLIQPPPSSVISSDAISHHESLIYFIARLTLGDVCGTTSGSENGTFGDGNLPLKKLKSSERISSQYFTEVMDDLVRRARKLENESWRLDRTTSSLDLRLELEDLQKFSIMNNFARFHYQINDIVASLDAWTPHPKRYCVAHHMPRNLPDGAHCLSL